MFYQNLAGPDQKPLNHHRAKQAQYLVKYLVQYLIHLFLKN